MDFSENNSLKKTKPKKSGWRIFFGIILVLSILANIFLFLMLGAMAMFVGYGQTQGMMEDTIHSGNINTKIAVVRLYGMIDSEAEQAVLQQLNSAQDDEKVKAVILKINSPGGGVSASDNIHHYIEKYKQITGNPVICYMDGLAASGGYYSAVACDEIVASPTTITGSIGVIMGHMQITGLLEEKLGIKPTTIKSGEKKDWPSLFREISEEEKQYLFNKVINPAYTRFVDLVNQGRENLTEDQVYQLADGSVYFAQEALNKGLIDGIGYMDNAIEVAANAAGIDEPKVIEYREPFSFSDMISSQSPMSILPDSDSLIEMSMPKLMYLWMGRN